MTVAAVVDGEAVGVDEVDRRLAALRATPFGSRLPSPATAEGRNARRWVAQLLCAQRLVEHEIALRGIVSTSLRPLTLQSALGMGGVAASLLAEIPGSPELVAEFVEPVPDLDVRGYYDRNIDLYGDGAMPFAQARAAIEAELRSARAEAAFALWLDRAMRDRVRMADGFEHPATPWSPDATHRH